MLGALATKLGLKSSAPLISAGAGLVGGLFRNKQAEQASAKQMAFQRDMSGTSYQRGMADMKKAGLNPILAGKFGGASTPTGSTYNPENVATSSAQVAMQSANVKQLIDQNRITKSNADFAEKTGLDISNAPNPIKYAYSASHAIQEAQRKRKLAESMQNRVKLPSKKGFSSNIPINKKPYGKAKVGYESMQPLLDFITPKLRKFFNY
jgi:hypothetical protein